MKTFGLTPSYLPHNKGMQTDRFKRYALVAAADAGRYAKKQGNPWKLKTGLNLNILSLL